MILLFYPIAIMIVAATYLIGFALWTFTAVFLCLVLPMLLYAVTFVGCVIYEVSRAIWRRTRPREIRISRRPVKSPPQAFWSNRR